MSGLASNLVAEAIGLVIGLIVTYFIVDQLLKSQAKRSWAPARKRLLSTLKRQCDGAIISWAFNTDPPRLDRTELGVTLSKNILDRLAEELKSELDSLLDVKDQDIFFQRPQLYWRAQVHGLATIKDSLRLAVDRAQLTLGDDPELVQAIAELEMAYMPVPGLKEHLQALDNVSGGADTQANVAQENIEKQLRLGAISVVRSLRRFHDLRVQLHDIPGALG